MLLSAHAADDFSCALFSRKNHVKITRCHHDSSVFSTRPFPRIQERARPCSETSMSPPGEESVVSFVRTYFAGLTVVLVVKLGILWNFEKFMLLLLRVKIIYCIYFCRELS